jgi:hypothetical protein
MRRQVYFVGSESEVAHHAAPLANVDSFLTQIVAADEVVQTAKSGDVAVFYSEHFDRFRQAIVELRAKRVATIYLVDGILEWRNAWENSAEEPACPFTMRPVLSDKVAVIGASQARTLSSWGNGGKIEVVGIPRLDALVDAWQSSEGFQPSKDKEPLRVLVATAKTPGFTADQIATTVRSLQDLKSFIGENPMINGRSLEVVWRLTAGLETEIDAENSISTLTGSELHQAIDHCDAMITTPSTSMLESMLKHKPTALLDYHHCPDYVPASWKIHSADSIKSVLGQLAAPCSARIQFQNSILFDALQVAESATDRLVQLIHSMFAASDGLLASSNPLEFDANLLPEPVFTAQLRARHCKMDHRACFRNFNEFHDDSEIEQTQAQLAHARREIEHLHRIEYGLRAELAEAHSIFEQIQQHPIAGPIVRIRERFIQFMSRNKED